MEEAKFSEREHHFREMRLMVEKAAYFIKDLEEKNAQLVASTEASNAEKDHIQRENSVLRQHLEMARMEIADQQGQIRMLQGFSYAEPQQLNETFLLTQ